MRVAEEEWIKSLPTSSLILLSRLYRVRLTRKRAGENLGISSPTFMKKLKTNGFTDPEMDSLNALIKSYEAKI